MRHYSELSPLEKKAREAADAPIALSVRYMNYAGEMKMCIDCVDYPVCCLSGRSADDEPCEYFQEETDPEEPGNNKD